MSRYKINKGKKKLKKWKLWVYLDNNNTLSATPCILKIIYINYDDISLSSQYTSKFFNKMNVVFI